MSVTAEEATIVESRCPWMPSAARQRTQFNGIAIQETSLTLQYDLIGRGAKAQA